MSLRRLASKISTGMAYPGHQHFAQRLLSRRTFLEKTGLTVGALAASGLLAPELARSAALKPSRTQQHNDGFSASHSRRSAIARPGWTTVPRVPTWSGL